MGQNVDCGPKDKGVGDGVCDGLVVNTGVIVGVIADVIAVGNVVAVEDIGGVFLILNMSMGVCGGVNKGWNTDVHTDKGTDVNNGDYVAVAEAVAVAVAEAEAVAVAVCMGMSMVGTCMSMIVCAEADHVSLNMSFEICLVLNGTTLDVEKNEVLRRSDIYALEEADIDKLEVQGNFQVGGCDCHCSDLVSILLMERYYERYLNPGIVMAMTLSDFQDDEAGEARLKNYCNGECRTLDSSA